MRPWSLFAILFVIAAATTTWAKAPQSNAPPKPIRILYIEGAPRWEFRAVKSYLTRENKAFDLKVLLLDADPDWPAHEKTALSEFPSKKELDQFDVVILGDFDPKQLPKSKENLRNLADFVKDHGGGLLMIAGEHFAPHAYKDTPLADVLPINIVKERQPAEPKEGLTESYRPRADRGGPQASCVPLRCRRKGSPRDLGGTGSHLLVLGGIRGGAERRCWRGIRSRSSRWSLGRRSAKARVCSSASTKPGAGGRSRRASINSGCRRCVIWPIRTPSNPVATLSGGFPHVVAS